MDAKVCFVCGGSVDTDIFLSVGKTLYSKTTYPTKISQLIGDDFMVVVSEEDKVCQRCTTLIDRFDKLEIDLLEIKTLITGFLSKNYNLSSGGNIEYAAEDLEYSKEISGFEDKDTLEGSKLTTMDNISPFVVYKQSSPLSDKKNEENNNQSCKELKAPKHDYDCTSVKSEPFRDWTDQSLKTATKINVNNTLSKELTECKHFLSNISVSATDAYNYKEFSILSPVLKSNIATSTIRDDYTLQVVKKESDLLGNCNINIPFHTQQTKTVMEELKLENMPDSCREFESANIKNGCSFPKNEPSLKRLILLPDNIVSINKPHSNSGLMNTEVKRTPPNSHAKKAKYVMNFTSCKRNLQRILPKPNSYVLETELGASVFDQKKTHFLTKNLGSKILKKCKIKIGTDLETKSSENVPLLVNNSKSVLINNIKEETTQDNVIACRFCKTEFENVTMLENHVIQHSKNGIPYSCCFCSKSFKSRSGLYSHTSTNHTKKFRFCCEVCGQGFTNQSSLDDHRNSHTKEYVCVCDICGKKFHSRGTYWIHRKWHFDPLPYRCSDCGQLFKHSSLLALHKRRKHTGERPYKCPYCILTFNVIGTFKRHLILHTKNYPFSCDMCKRGFTTRFKYGEHMLRVHSTLINKPHVDKKDYKVAVHNDKTKDADLRLIENISVSDNLVGGISAGLDKTLICSSGN